MAEDGFENMCRIHRLTGLKAINDISKGEMAVLGYLVYEHNEATAGELSDTLGMGSSRIAAILNTLTQKGLAKRNPDPEDGRRVLVYVTDKGREEAHRKRDEANAHMAEFLSLLGEEDAKAFLRIIRKAVELCDAKVLKH